jgi:hypothetical protein
VKLRKRERGEPPKPLRTWTRRADGETVYALHPLYVAMSKHYASGRPALERREVIERRLHEIILGERRLPESVAAEILELDRGDQASGCPDENISGLVALLQGRSENPEEAS